MEERENRMINSPFSRTDEQEIQGALKLLLNVSHLLLDFDSERTREIKRIWGGSDYRRFCK